MEHAPATIQAVSYLRFIVLFPLLGVLFNIFVGPRLGRKAVNFVAPGVVLLSFLFSNSHLEAPWSIPSTPGSPLARFTLILLCGSIRSRRR